MSEIYNDLFYQCMQAFYYDPANGAVVHPQSDPTNSQLALDKSTNLRQNTDMCDLNVRFVTAVLLAVGELRVNPFSVYQVTKKLREQVNQGELTFVDRELEDVEGSQTYRVDHQEVRSIFRELIDQKILTGLASRDAGPYLEYYNVRDTTTSTPPNQGVIPGPLPPLPPVVIPVPSPVTQTLVTCAGQKVSVPPPVADGVLYQRLKDYLIGRQGEEITMKQIQSRFKNVSKTCKEWADLLVNRGLILTKVGTPSNWVIRA